MSPSAYYLTRFAGGGDGQASVAGAIRTWWDRARTRAHDRADLSHITDFDLHDLGVTRAGLAFEIGKPFWRA